MKGGKSTKRYSRSSGNIGSGNHGECEEIRIFQAVHAEQQGENFQKEGQKEMTTEDYVKQSREEHRQIFGEVGVKKDCKHYKQDFLKQNCCDVCVKQWDKDKLQCECGVCYFYSKKA